MCTKMIFDRPGEDFYPLGKAPERNEEALPSILAGSGLAPPNKAKPKPTKKPSSFLDFLIPSFLSGRSSQADPEGRLYFGATMNSKA